MELFIIGIISIDALEKAISWTLIHSIWQGLLCSFLAALILMGTRKARPQLRYWLFTSVFFVFLLINASTLVLELNKAGNSGPIFNSKLTQNHAYSSDNAIKTYGSPFAIGANDYSERFIQFMNDHSSMLVAGWFLIFCFQFVRFLVGIGYLNRIKGQRVHRPTLHWMTRMDELASSLNIRHKILLFQSELVKVPVVAGFFKPIILVPMQMMLQLPAKEIEAILLHELAHIRRRDFWVNLLQRIVTLFYFFNPGLLWISSLISDERENCCDEVALEKIGNRKSYISALLSFEELNQSPSALGLAFPGRKNQLLHRVRRILYHQNQTLNNMEKMILTVCLLLIGLCPFAFSQPVKTEAIIPAKQATPAEPVKLSKEALTLAAAKPMAENIKVAPMIEDTVPKKAETVQKSAEGARMSQEVIYERDGYRIITREGKIRTAYYKGVKLSPTEMTKQKADLEKIIEKQDQDWMNSLNEAKNAEYSKELAEKQMQEAFEQAVKQTKELNEQLANNYEKVAKEQQAKMNETNLQALELQKQLAAIQYEKMANLQSERATIESQKETLEKLAKGYSLIQPVGRIIDMLMEKKIIDNTAELSFDLNNDEFTVNNVKQPASIHEEFKKEILKSPQDHVIYSVGKGSTRTDISIKD